VPCSRSSKNPEGRSCGSKASKFRRLPSELTLARAASAAERVKGSDAPIARAFVRAGGLGHPPLARLLRGGRGGEVRVKLYLSILWIARGDPYDTAFPARAWAELLGIEDAAGRGASRVADAIDWLDEHRFIRAERRPGYPPRLYLLSEDGSGQDYAHPRQRNEYYLKLSTRFWTRGWHAVLSGAAVTILLISLDQVYRPKGRNKESFWLSPRRARELYGISPDTWLKGRTELARHDLLHTGRYIISDDPFAVIRIRNVYYPHLEHLDDPPG